MLEGLDSVDWASLQHAYGPATDVPQLLQSLLSSNMDERREACLDLHERVWHQGTVYPASAAVVPLLCELLSGDNELARGCAVSLLCCMATGSGWLQYGIRINGEERIREQLKKQGRSLEECLADEQAVLERIRSGVSAGLHNLVPFLYDTAGLANLVADVLGLFPEHASWTIPVIDAALQENPDEHLKQQLINSKARLTRLEHG